MPLTRRSLNRALLGAALAPLAARAAADPQNRLDAGVDRIELDNRLEPGRTYRPRITLRNTGNLRWEKGAVLLRFENSAGPHGKPVRSERFRFEAPVDQEVLPGETVVVQGSVVAPPQPGTWEMTAAVLHRREELGKPLTERVEVLAGYRARIESVRMEEVVRPDRDTELIVRLLNNGKSEWGPEEVDFFLTVRKASGSTTLFRGDWETHVELKKPVPPNEQVELRFKIRPRRAGTVTLQFSMWDRKRRDDFGEVEYRAVTVA